MLDTHTTAEPVTQEQLLEARRLITSCREILGRDASVSEITSALSFLRSADMSLGLAQQRLSSAAPPSRAKSALPVNSSHSDEINLPAIGRFLTLDRSPIEVFKAAIHVLSKVESGASFTLGDLSGELQAAQLLQTNLSANELFSKLQRLRDVRIISIGSPRRSTDFSDASVALTELGRDLVSRGWFERFGLPDEGTEVPHR